MLPLSRRCWALLKQHYHRLRLERPDHRQKIKDDASFRSAFAEMCYAAGVDPRYARTKDVLERVGAGRHTTSWGSRSWASARRRAKKTAA